MTTKTSKALMLIPILALAGALLVTGCGGGSSSSSSSATESTAPAEAGGTGGAEAGGETAGGNAAMAEGMTVFAANCASCHTLKAAKARATSARTSTN